MNKENIENVNRSNEPEKAAAGPLTVIYTDTVYGKEAEALAEHTGAGKAQYTENAPAHDQGAGLMLLLDDSGLSLTDGKISLQADLTSMLPRLKKKQPGKGITGKSVKDKGHERR